MKQFPEFEFLSYPRNAKVPDEVLARAEVLMNYGDKSQIAPAKNVRYIHTISAGIDGYIDEVDRCHGSALPVTNGAGVYSDAVGEHVIALLLAVVHGIVPSVRNMAEKQWPAIPMLGNVNGKTIAVLGTGDIGNNAARICAAMGARVLGISCITNMAAGVCDQTLSHEEVTEVSHRAANDFQRLMAAIVEAIV